MASDFMAWPACADGAARRIVRLPQGTFSPCHEDAVVMKQAKPASRVSAVDTVFAPGDA